jgi:acyl-CoA synthetase (AMP-forming)/AMP-acid ligase II
MIYDGPAAEMRHAYLSLTDRVMEGISPDKVILTDGPTGAQMTGAMFRDRVDRLAMGLFERGFEKRTVVAIMAPNAPDYAVVFHAVLKTGAAVTTINPSYTTPELAHQLSDSGATLLITSADLLPIATPACAKSGVGQILLMGQPAEGHPGLEDWMGEPLTEQMDYGLYTDFHVLPYSSGTTGLPKGVMLSHPNMVVNVDQTIAAFDIRPDDVAVAFLPFFHIYGMNALMNAHLAAGASIVTMPRFDLAAMLGHLQTHRARVLLVAPPVALALAKHPMVADYDLSALEVVFSAAAPLGADVAEALGNRLGCTVIQGYGMTEMSPVSHCVPASAPKAGSVGKTVSNTSTRIVDPSTLRDVTPGAEGEVWVRGPQVMLGYHKRSDVTAETIRGDWLRTGDLGVMDEDGYLFIRGRLKELIKVKGFQVAPAEVEAALLVHPEVLDAAVIGRPDDEAGEVPVAFVVLSPGAKASAESLRDALRERLASYKLPVETRFVAAIPKSASGKILRRVLTDQLAEG